MLGAQPWVEPGLSPRAPPFLGAGTSIQVASAILAMKVEGKGTQACLSFLEKPVSQSQAP